MALLTKPTRLTGIGVVTNANTLNFLHPSDNLRPSDSLLLDADTPSSAASYGFRLPATASVYPATRLYASGRLLPHRDLPLVSASYAFGLTGRASAFTNYGTRISGRLTSAPKTVDLRIAGSFQTSTAYDFRLTGKLTSISSANLRTKGGILASRAQDFRIPGIGTRTTSEVALKLVPVAGSLKTYGFFVRGIEAGGPNTFFSTALRIIGIPLESARGRDRYIRETVFSHNFTS